LKVPKIRSIIEYSNFVVLFFLYVVAMEGLVDTHMNKRELAFVVYALGELSTVFQSHKLMAQHSPLTSLPRSGREV
jgi:hypothetical protein